MWISTGGGELRERGRWRRRRVGGEAQEGGDLREESAYLFGSLAD